MEMNAHYITAFSVRIVLLLYGIFHDAYFQVKYTDIDYNVFTDAAEFVYNGKSPFERQTYRYTPFLAFLMIFNILIHHTIGKLIFCIFDVLTGVLIYKILRNYKHHIQMCKISAFLWLYNPLCIIISTRGSSESIMTFLIMMSIFLYQEKQPLLFGLVYGFAVHVKIYPIIYVLTFYIILTNFPPNSTYSLKTVFYMLYPNKNKFYFIMSLSAGFLLPTLLSYYLYGSQYVNEAFLYHLVRKDIRHNFSPYFYLLYLSEAVDSEFGALISSIAFLVQAVLILFVSFVFYMPQALPACLFIQTFVFVIFNKVCTSQYFLWYLCLFPLNVTKLKVKISTVIRAMLLWFMGQFLWLIPAYYLEFHGINTFVLLWLASLAMLFINAYIITKFISFCPYPVPPMKMK